MEILLFITSLNREFGFTGLTAFGSLSLANSPFPISSNEKKGDLFTK